MVGLAFLGGASLGVGQVLAPEGGPTEGESAAAEPKEWVPEEFSVGMVIHPAIARLAQPELFKELISTPMAISARNEAAQEHTVQGMAYVQAGWDYEAYRHFCEAARADPECLMAYWGIGLSLAAPNSEFIEQRMAAVNRMLDLVEDGQGSPQERDYAMSLLALFSGDVSAASASFAKLSERFPNDLQARLIATYFKRDGFTEFGDALYGQERATEEMAKIMAENPDNLAAMGFWAMLHAEHPDAEFILPKEVLPVVRKMVRMVPDFPPYLHMLGHFEWRCGNHVLALEAFERALKLYSDHMKANEMTFHDCEAYVRTKSYMAVALASLGRFEEALKVAKELAALKVESKRLNSAGANLVVWNARTLPARIYLARGWESDFSAAAESFPKAGDEQLFIGRTISVFYLEGLRQYIEGRKSLVNGDREEAGDFLLAAEQTLARMAGLRREAAGSSAISEYLRALRTLEILSADLRGHLALAGSPSEKKGAYNWFKSASEKQSYGSMLNPPSLPYPLEVCLGDYYMRSGRGAESVASYEEALLRRPNDVQTMRELLVVLKALKLTEDAAELAKRMKYVTGK